MDTREGVTLWLYKLILKHMLKYHTKFRYIDFVWPLTPSSLMDIWHLVSNKQVICKKCLEMAIRKKVRFLGLAQIYLFLMDKFLKKGIYGTKRCLLLVRRVINECSDKNQLLRCALSPIIGECCLYLAEISNIFKNSFIRKWVHLSQP